MKKRFFALIGFFVCMLSYSFSQKPIESLEIYRPATNNYSSTILPDKEMSIEGKTTTEIARNYIKNNWLNWGHNISFENTIVQDKILNMESGDIVRFIQKFKGLKVFNGLITIKFTAKKQIHVVINESIPIRPDFEIQPTIPENDARKILLKHLGIVDAKKTNTAQLVICAVGSEIKLAYLSTVSTKSPIGAWRALVDANTGRILEVRNLVHSCRPGHAHHKNTSKVVAKEPTSKKTKSISAPIAVADGAGTVYGPNPVVSAKAQYGDQWFIDNDDVSNWLLDQQMMDVTLEGITLESDNNYYLKGDHAELVDIDEPFDGLFGQSSTDFSCIRSDRKFEAVMCYYHINQSKAYADNVLGMEIPTDNPSGIESVPFDPHLSHDTDVGAWFFTADFAGLGVVAFGDANDDDDGENVDAGEDATLILHELGHGLHYWLTLPSDGTANHETMAGLSEGLADYWGKSNTRNCDLYGNWEEWEEDYHKIFQWALMPFAENSGQQRTTNVTGAFTPQSPSNTNLHETGQFMSSALMRIYSDIGKYKTDKLVLEAMPMLTTGGYELREAGVRIYNTATNLNLSGDLTDNDLCIIYNHLDAKLGISFENVPAPTGGSKDIYMKDGACDIGEEVNTSTQFAYHSPDIWIRNEKDDELEHQNAEYKINDVPNHVYVRIRGIGCGDVTDAVLRVYYSHASTSLGWPEKWEEYTMPGSGGQTVTAGDEITGPLNPLLLSSFVTSENELGAGNELIISIPWVVPNPADFLEDVEHFCLLARIESIEDPISLPEVLNVGTNSLNNNNIVTKNITVVDEEPGVSVLGPYSVFVGCVQGVNTGQVTVESPPHYLNKSVFDFGKVYLELQGQLKTNWVNNGKLGTGYEEQLDGKIWAKDESFILEGLTLTGCENRRVHVYFEPFPEVRECVFDLVQYHVSDGASVTEEGRERFEYRKREAIGGRNGQPDLSQSSTENGVVLYPNPAKETVRLVIPDDIRGNLKYQIIDFQGKLFQNSSTNANQVEISIINLSPGIYFLNLQNEKGEIISNFKFIKH